MKKARLMQVIGTPVKGSSKSAESNNIVKVWDDINNFKAMTPKEKAEDLLRKFWLYEEHVPLAKQMAKAGALACVQEIYDALTNVAGQVTNKEYWQDVVLELVNL